MKYTYLYTIPKIIDKIKVRYNLDFTQTKV